MANVLITFTGATDNVIDLGRGGISCFDPDFPSSTDHAYVGGRPGEKPSS
jgi:hypothetical protein